MELWTAVTIGFFGSFHCLGMCGPIALALPGRGGAAGRFAAGRLLYNFGRITTYSLMGALFGIFGHSAALAGLQQSLSIALGILIIAGVLIQSPRLARWWQAWSSRMPFARLQQAIRRQFSRQGMPALYTIGLLNGLLPCGFVYMGLAGSLTTGSVTGGALYMMLFGLGTFPAMFGIALAPDLLTFRMRARINRVIPYLTLSVGLYLVYRGLAWGGSMH